MYIHTYIYIYIDDNKLIQLLSIIKVKFEPKCELTSTLLHLRRTPPLALPPSLLHQPPACTCNHVLSYDMLQQLHYQYRQKKRLHERQESSKLPR